MEKAHGRRWLRPVLYVLLTAAVLLLTGICAVNIAIWVWLWIYLKMIHHYSKLSLWKELYELIAM